MRQAKYLVSAFLLVLIATTPHRAQEPTVNILSRVFLIKFGSRVGTGFTIEVQNRQYLITARHNVDGIKDGDTIEILQNEKLRPFTVRPLYVAPAEVDIIVLVLPTQVSPTFPLEPSANGIILAQNMYFLGFPFDLRMPGDVVNFGFPVPLVKSGICSAIIASPAKDYSVIFVDGMNNPGFSGGPIVFIDKETKKLKVAGVIKGYRNQEDIILRKVPKKDKNPGEAEGYDLIETDLVTRSNTGLVVGFSIQSAVDVILRNPIGPQVKN